MDRMIEVRREAWACHKAKRYREAESLYKILLNQGPNAGDISNLGALLRKGGRTNEAFKLYKEWINKVEITAGLTLNSANCAIECEQLDAAGQWLEKGLIKFPEDVGLRQCNARLKQAYGNIEDAIKILSNLIKEDENNVEALLELGLAFHRNNKKQDALDVFYQVFRLKPNEERVSANIITILQEVGKYEEANTHYEGLSENLKTSNLVSAAMAFMYMQMQEMEKADKEFTRLCSIDPMQASHWLNRCACLRAIKKGHAAYRVIRDGLKIHPDNKLLKHLLTQCYAEIGKMDQAKKLLLNSNEETLQDDQQLFNLQFMGEGYSLIESNQLKTLAQDWESNIIDKGIDNIWCDYIQESIKNRKVKIGYLSADFCNHPVGRFIIPILKNHKRDKFEITIISNTKQTDTITKYIRRYSDDWIDIQNKDDIDAARMIGDRQIDILIELGGYTSDSRIGILCYKPAKIQLSYLGYFAPTYLKSVNGWIGDEVLFNELKAEHKNEHDLLMVKGGYMAYEDRIWPNINRFKGDRVRFGCFNHSRKLSEETLSLFARIIDETKDSELILKSISFKEKEEQDRVRSILLKHGIDENRLIIIPMVKGRKNHLLQYNNMDYALDTFPYGGATTTCEALNMGIPVVTLQGRTMAQNLSASILWHAGLEEMIAKDEDEYLLIAKKLHKKGKNKNISREGLREKIKRSQLCDSERLCREIEKIYYSELDRFEKVSSSD